MFFPSLDFQIIPPENETSIKIAEFFLGFDPKAVLQRKDLSEPSLNYDAVFIIDASKSITRSGHRKSLSALRILMEKANPATKFAAISFSNKATIRFKFVPQEEAIEKINFNVIPFERGDTNTQAALRKCTKLIRDPKNGARPGIPKRVLILTDGQSNMHKEMTLYRSFELKHTGAQVFVIAIGEYIAGIDEIVSLASSSHDHLYRVRDTDGLIRIVKLVPRWSNING